MEGLLSVGKAWMIRLLLKGWNPASGYFGGQFKAVADQNFGKQRSYTAPEGMWSRAFAFSFDSFKPRDPKHSPLSLTTTVSCVSEKRLF